MNADIILLYFLLVIIYFQEKTSSLLNNYALLYKIFIRPKKNTKKNYF